MVKMRSRNSGAQGSFCSLARSVIQRQVSAICSYVAQLDGPASEHSHPSRQLMLSLRLTDRRRSPPFCCPVAG